MRALACGLAEKGFVAILNRKIDGRLSLSNRRGFVVSALMMLPVFGRLKLCAVAGVFFRQVRGLMHPGMRTQRGSERASPSAHKERQHGNADK